MLIICHVKSPTKLEVGQGTGKGHDGRAKVPQPHFRGVCVPGAIDSVLGEISFAVALTKSYHKGTGKGHDGRAKVLQPHFRGVCVPEEIDSVFLLCFGGHFFRCSINQKLPKSYVNTKARLLPV